MEDVLKKTFYAKIKEKVKEGKREKVKKA